VIGDTVKIYITTTNALLIELNSLLTGKNKDFFIISVESFRFTIAERFDWAYSTNKFQFICDVFISLQLLLF
jgi:hypothetical protein